jgi:site-specific recombinase XerC
MPDPVAMSNRFFVHNHLFAEAGAVLDERGLTVQDFSPACAVATLRHMPSNRRAQRLDLAATVEGGRLLSARTCNRILAAVSSFYEFLIICERYSGRANPIQKQADPAARRAVAGWRPPLLNSSKQVPVRRTLRVKTVDALPRPISDETYRALISVMRTKRDRALLELMHGKRSRHCQPGEYEEFLADSIWREDRRRRLLGKQRRFANTYPDLDAWMQLPLQIRLGWRNNETQARRTRAI